jgi:hypothetical protein
MQNSPALTMPAGHALRAAVARGGQSTSAAAETASADTTRLPITPSTADQR